MLRARLVDESHLGLGHGALHGDGQRLVFVTGDCQILLSGSRDTLGNKRIGIGCYLIVQKVVLISEVFTFRVSAEITAKACFVGNGIEVIRAAGIEVAEAHGVAGRIVRHRERPVEAYFLRRLIDHDDTQILHALAFQNGIRVGIVAGSACGERERHARLVCGREAFFLDAGGQAAGQQQEHRAGVFQ